MIDPFVTLVGLSPLYASKKNWYILSHSMVPGPEAVIFNLNNSVPLGTVMLF